MTPRQHRPDRLVIAVDSSTTSTKALIVDGAGDVLAQGRADLSMTTPKVDHYEQDPHAWWQTTDEAIAAAVAALDPSDRGRISHLCCTAQRQTFALVDADGDPLRPGIVWLDGRASDQVRRLGSAQLHERSGFQPDVTPSLYKLAWLREHEPDALERTDRVATVHAWLVHALTGEWVDSRGTADSLGLFSMAEQEWSAATLDLLGLDPGQLPALVDPLSEIGEVRPEITRGWGLEQPVTVVAGCGDGQAAALGAGAVAPDVAYLNMGTALVAGVHSETYRTADVFRTDAAGIPGHYVLEIVQNSGAYLTGWFRERLGRPDLSGRPDPDLDAAAAAVSPGCGGLLTLPYWNAVQSPHWDPFARGAVVGLAGQHDRATLYRSLLEGISVEMARNLRGLSAAIDLPLSSIRVVGGGQRSGIWRRIITDAVGIGLTEVNQEEVSALGAAVMAHVAAGTHATAAEAAVAMSAPGTTSEPDPQTASVYAELADLQAELYPALHPIFEAQHAFAMRHPLS